LATGHLGTSIPENDIPGTSTCARKSKRQ